MDSDYSFFSISDAEQRQSSFTDISLLHESGKGFCRIFLARLFGRKVILKTLKAEFADSAPHRNLLYKEYIIGRDMSHPGIAATYLFARDIDGIGDAIVMEYVEGVTLKQWLADNPPMPPALARDVVRQLADALGYIHARQIVHRDLKPSNIMVTAGCRYIKIIDFGLSDGSAYVDFKYPGGIRRYGAPEQFDSDALVDSRTDIYALGLIMEELTLGSDRPLRRAGRRCHALSPSDRPANVREVTHLIDRYDRRRRAMRRCMLASCTLAAIGTIFCLTYPRPADIAAPHTLSRAQLPAIATADTASTLPFSPDTAFMLPPLPVPEDTGQPLPALSDDDAAGADTQPSADAEPFEQQVYKYATQVAARRFAGQLALLDTMTTTRSMELAEVGHWKWLARQDVSKWLAQTIDEKSPYKDDLMDLAARTIERYDKDHTAEEYPHKVRAYKRVGGVCTVISYRLEDGRLRTDSLCQDGNWSMSIVDDRARQMRLNSSHRY